MSCRGLKEFIVKMKTREESSQITVEIIDNDVVSS